MCVVDCYGLVFDFFFKQKTAYELRISDWSSDVCSSDLSLGSACGSGSGKVSHVLRAMGVSEADARASIRLGWGRYTSEAELRDGLNAIRDAARLQGVN